MILADESGIRPFQDQGKDWKPQKLPHKLSIQEVNDNMILIWSSYDSHTASTDSWESEPWKDQGRAINGPTRSTAAGVLEDRAAIREILLQSVEKEKAADLGVAFWDKDDQSQKSSEDSSKSEELGSE